MREMWLDAVLPAPLLPPLPKLAAVIGQYRFRMPPPPFLQSRHLPGSWLMVKLLSPQQEPAVVVDAGKEPVFPARGKNHESSRNNNIL